jgi:hypothetical protein
MPGFRGRRGRVDVAAALICSDETATVAVTLLSAES